MTSSFPTFPTTPERVRFVRETLAVVGGALPILISQAMVVAVLVYAGQGRAFLAIGDSSALAYCLLLNAIAAVVFTRLLSQRGPAGRSAAPDRPRWLAVHCGAVVAGLVAGFLPAILLELYVAGATCATPVAILDSYRGSAAVFAGLVALSFFAYLIWRLRSRKGDGTNTRDVAMFLAALVLGPASRIWPSHHLLLYGASLLLLWVLLNLLIVPGSPPPPPTKAVDAVAVVFAAGSALAGLLITAFPALSSSAVVLCVIAQVWTTLVVGAVLLLRRLWAGHLAWFVVALAFLGIGVIAFFRGAFHARDVRTLAGPATDRPPLAELAKDWIQARSERLGAGRPYPVFVVAAAGGGIRAAYWTANLLAALEDTQPAFAEHVFAISGVSGGSVGAAIFDALIENRCKPCRPAAQKILAHDFLGPAIAAMLTRDVVSATLHVELPGLPDRGIVLENAFERAWREAMPTRTLEESFDGLWRGDGRLWVPGLFLNATEATSAGRVVFSNASMTTGPNIDAAQAAAERMPLRLSTAMLLSARFPYVSPEGRAGSADTPLRLVDGGYFDNSGAATLLDVVRALHEAVGTDRRFQVVALLVANEPVAAKTSCPSEPDVGGAATPLAILDKLRGERADDFARRLEALVCEREGTGDFCPPPLLRPESGPAEFPLGWSLARATMHEMDAQIEERMAGKDPVVALVRALEASRM